MNTPDHDGIVVDVERMHLETGIPITEINQALSEPPEHIASEDMHAKEIKSFDAATVWWQKRFETEDEKIFLLRMLELAQNISDFVTLYRCTKRDTPIRFATICAAASFFTENKEGS